MEMKIIDSRDLNLSKRGYRWADNSVRVLDNEYWDYQDCLYEEDIDDVLDSFTDGTYPICVGDDGKLYSVMFRVSKHEDGAYWYRPVIWEQVERKNNMKWFESDIDIVEIDGELYALYGWNGEKWLHCWKCVDRFTADPDGKEYEVTPVYDWERWNEEDGEFQDADGNAIDGIIGYEVA